MPGLWSEILTAAAPDKAHVIAVDPESDQAQQKCNPSGRLVGMTSHAVDFIRRNDEPVDLVYSKCNDRKHDAKCNVSSHSASHSFLVPKVVKKNRMGKA